MNRLLSTLLLAVALAACAKNTSRPSLKLNGPTGVAVYRGYGASKPGELRHLVAIANTRGDDLRIIDALTDQAEVAPTVVAALSVPTEPRPSRIAAGRLGDLDASLAPVARPDLLVVAPTGLVARPGLVGQYAASIQLVETWSADTTVADTIDLGDVAPDAALVSLAVVPLWKQVAGAWTRQAGGALVVAGLTDGSLITMEASRVAGSEAIALAPPVRQDLGFTPLDLAVSADDGQHLYAATLDVIPGSGGVLGVAELDLAGAPGALAFRAISARAGTTKVAALDVAPFISNDYGAQIPNFDNFGPKAPRVLAAIDNRACGRDRSIPCGVAILDPVTGGLARDPAGLQPYQMPFQLDGEVVAMAVSGAPVVSSQPGYLELAPGSGKRWTQSMAAISSSSGRIYLADLSHFALASDASALVGTTATRVTSSGSFGPSINSNPIGVWQRQASISAPHWSVLLDVVAALGIAVTPGFTPSDTWTVAWQGELPGLKDRDGVAWVPAGAPQPPARIALQQATGLTTPGSEAWRTVVRVYDPRLAIRNFDIVEVSGFPAGVCPRGKFEMLVTGLLPPSADAPGGSIAVTPAASQPTNAGQVLPADPNCLDAGAWSQVTVTIRGWGYVASGLTTGYVGRPAEVQNPEDPTELPFEVRSENEDLLSCPIMPDAPEDWPPSPAAVAACEADAASCRATCERLVIARRARRLFYVTTRCGAAWELACYNLWVLPPNGLSFPMPDGPLFSFKLGVKRNNGGYAPPERGGFLTFSTGSGFYPTSREPYLGGNYSGSVLPGGVVLHDRTEVTGVAGDGIHGFAAFTGNMVLDFASGSAGQSAVTIR